MKGFRFGSAQGSFYIMPGRDGWEATLNNDTLGAFSTPEKAAEVLAKGLTCPDASEVDTATLELPEKLTDWEIVHV
jgi:hypothetical protein